MSVLLKIVEKKRGRLAQARARCPLVDLRARIRDTEPPRDFMQAVKRETGPLRMIAEIKKASPSRGMIRKDFDPVRIASIYEAQAVDAISVITEEDYFGGSLGFLPAVKSSVTRAVLRKDFVIDAYHIYEARAYGADAVLLIAAILEGSQAGEYLHLAGELGMAVLFEVHDQGDLEMAFNINAPIIGINNRDLTSLKIDLSTTLLLRSEVPRDRIVVSESGINTRGDMLVLEKAGVDAVLIGTAIMESEDIAEKIINLRGK